MSSLARYALGIDYGTSSCRSLLVDLATGNEIAGAVFPYPSGQHGVVSHPGDPDVARQEPGDYLKGLERCVTDGLEAAGRLLPNFSASDVATVGFATTGSTPIPVDADGTALALAPQFRDRLAAKAWLWKDHTAHVEAERITETAMRMRPQYVDACGGTYSAEWFWAKVWHCLEVDPDVFDAAYTWVELCDYVVGVLTGTSSPGALNRSVTAAGHKAMYAESWGGLPDKEFLAALHPKLAELRGRLYDEAHSTTEIAGRVTEEWAAKTGLPVGTPVAVGHFDAHAAGVAAGVREGTFVKVMGTSTCDVTVIGDDGLAPPSIPGMCGVVRDAIIPGKFSVEAGQSAVGDIFSWFSGGLLGEGDVDAALEEIGVQAAALSPGEHGLLALDWFNGNRSVLVDQRLSGVILGLTLHTSRHHVLKALVEATAYGARRIIDRIEERGHTLSMIVAAGGLPSHAPWMIQTYADVLGREIHTTRTTQGSALGAAIVAAVAVGEFVSIEAAQDALVHHLETPHVPSEASTRAYDVLYAQFNAVHDAFAADGSLGDVMKILLDVRDHPAGAQDGY
jgi:L-ribulokinase